MSSAELVSNIRVGFVAREGSRRIEESKKIDFWREKQSDADAKAAGLAVEVNKQWDKVLNKNKPYQLYEYLMEQKRQCHDLIAVKKKLEQEYLNEIKSKDDEYVKELKRQAEEIDMLVERMNKQYQNFQIQFVEEFEQIEKAFVEERNQLITLNYKEIETLLENRRKNEA